MQSIEDIIASTYTELLNALVTRAIDTGREYFKEQDTNKKESCVNEMSDLLGKCSAVMIMRDKLRGER